MSRLFKRPGTPNQKPAAEKQPPTPKKSETPDEKRKIFEQGRETMTRKQVPFARSLEQAAKPQTQQFPIAGIAK